MADTTDLPSFLADLSLFPATREQIIESHKRTAVQWARGRSLEEYLQAEATMETREQAADGKFVVWVLAPRSNPATLDFMCSCETFRRTALVARRQTGSSTTESQNVTAYAIASVFTPAKNRKKGYARHMMRLLHWVLAPRSALPPTFPKAWGTPPDEEILLSVGAANAQFSVLYSDVGPEFYQSSGSDATSRDGWHVTGAKETYWTLDPNADTPSPARPHAAATPNDNLKRLTEQEVIALYDHDARWIQEDLSRPVATGSDATHSPTRFTFLPDKGVGGYNIWRKMQFTPDLKPFMPTSQWAIAILPPSTSDLADALVSLVQHSEQGASSTIPFVSWTLDSAGDSRILVVTRLRADERTFPVLLEEIKAVAYEERAAKIEFWYLEPQLRTIAEAKGWKTADRTEHLSSVKWYSEGSEEQLAWVYNEKFCWC